MPDLLVESFKQKLSRHIRDVKLDLIINENRSTMLHLLARKKDSARLSVHKMFLDAPENVISAIAHYVRGSKKYKNAGDLLIRGYIQSNLTRFNYANKLNQSKFVTVGRFYNLQEIYEEINHAYFQGKVDIKITWYGERGRRARSRIIFGQYFDHLHLVKIHRMLDDPFFPSYFVRYVVFHEMLHHVVPGRFDGKGIYRSHSHEFKQGETLFADYEKAIAWEKKNRDRLFRGV